MNVLMVQCPTLSLAIVTSLLRALSLIPAPLATVPARMALTPTIPLVKPTKSPILRGRLNVLRPKRVRMVSRLSVKALPPVIFLLRLATQGSSTTLKPVSATAVPVTPAPQARPVPPAPTTHPATATGMTREAATIPAPATPVIPAAPVVPAHLPAANVMKASHGARSTGKWAAMAPVTAPRAKAGAK